MVDKQCPKCDVMIKEDIRTVTMQNKDTKEPEVRKFSVYDCPCGHYEHYRLPEPKKEPIKVESKTKIIGNKPEVKGSPKLIINEMKR